ncbi:HAMP domain-containing histidine kinase [Myxococcaceae bacterium JPH2]|nr:HAMP domain-containing histidine kinase [Myxococcaceae bacterium JPH2]
MTRRLLPTLIALVLGLAGLGVGLWSLQSIFIDERDDARAALRSQREALEQYARASLRQSLRRELEGVRHSLEAARWEPLLPATGLYLREHDEQLLPRLARFSPAKGAPAQDRYARLRAGTEVTKAGEGPWAERLALMKSVERALAVKGRTAATMQALGALFFHRTHYMLASSRDLPSLLLVVERVAAQGGLLPDVMRAMVREGWRGGPGSVGMEGLQRLLLLKRSKLTAADFQFLRERITTLSMRLGIPADDFEARAQELATAPLDLPEHIDGPVLARSGWYLEPDRGAIVRGVTVNVPAHLEALTREMRERGLLSEDGTVTLPGDEPVLLLASLPVSVESPLWARGEAALARRHALKSFMVGMCAVLAFVIAGLAFLAQHRKHRFLELKSDFVATVSHELRTPLASIRLLAETLEWRVAEGAGARDYPARIIREADGLGFLVENLLSFNRIDKGRWTPKLAPVRWDELLAGLRQDLEGWTQVPVSLSADVGDHGLNGDAQLLRLLLANLGRNACLYNTRDPVCLRVEVFPGGRLRFSDNGVGIPESEWEHVFDEFRRLPSVGRRDVPGSGLGLSLCRRIAALHGGSLRVAASSPEGTTFELSFPER